MTRRRQSAQLDGRTLAVLQSVVDEVGHHPERQALVTANEAFVRQTAPYFEPHRSGVHPKCRGKLENVS